jgi:glycosyltransferase involved in cell wall biosynthesis
MKDELYQQNMDHAVKAGHDISADCKNFNHYFTPSLMNKAQGYGESSPQPSPFLLNLMDNHLEIKEKQKGLLIRSAHSQGNFQPAMLNNVELETIGGFELKSLISSLNVFLGEMGSFKHIFISISELEKLLFNQQSMHYEQMLEAKNTALLFSKLNSLLKKNGSIIIQSKLIEHIKGRKREKRTFQEVSSIEDSIIDQQKKDSNEYSSSKVHSSKIHCILAVLQELARLGFTIKVYSSPLYHELLSDLLFYIPEVVFENNPFEYGGSKTLNAYQSEYTNEQVYFKVVKSGPGTGLFKNILSRKPKAVVFNNFFRTAGGGERSSIDIARALDELGFEIELAVDHYIDMTVSGILNPFVKEEEVKAQYQRKWSLRQYASQEDMYLRIENEKTALFVNHTYCSFLRNPAPIGLYAVMFPHQNISSELEKLRSYTKLLCNSKFTEFYLKQSWGDFSTEVLYPPISKDHLDKPEVTFDEKKKVVIVVGRFSVAEHAHNKRQLDAIKAFKGLLEKNIIDDSWKMYVAGNINEGKEEELYLQICKEAAIGYPIELLPNLKFQELQNLYRRATCLWQFTGANLDYGVNPGSCEHLGLVALDCYAYGTLPICYDRGGMTSVLEHGANGYIFHNTTDLETIMREVNNNFGNAFHKVQFQAVKQRADEFSFRTFKSKLENIIMSSPHCSI